MLNVLHIYSYRGSYHIIIVTQIKKSCQRNKRMNLQNLFINLKTQFFIPTDESLKKACASSGIFVNLKGFRLFFAA